MALARKMAGDCCSMGAEAGGPRVVVRRIADPHVALALPPVGDH